MFLSYYYCVSWSCLYEILQQMSIFLVMLLSLTRTLSIVRPMLNIRRRVVLSILVLYFSVLAVEKVIGFIPGVDYSYTYSFDDPNCWSGANSNVSLTTITSLYTIRVGVPPIITFVSFIISTSRLWGMKRIGNMRRVNDASITIALFTGLFLLCNIPYFINLVMWTSTMMYEYPGEWQ